MVEIPLQSEQSRILYRNMIDATYEYFKHISSVYPPKFVKETANKVWDKDHWAYKCYFPNNEEEDKEVQPLDKSEKTEEIKKLYKKIAMRYHPDKCEEEWSKVLFQTVTKIYDDNDYENLIRIDKILSMGETEDIERILEEEKKFEEKEHFINKAKSSVWFEWMVGKDCSTIKQILITPQEYNERLRERNIKLKEEKDRLEKELQILRKI